MKNEKTMNQIISKIAEKHSVSTKHVYSQIEKHSGAVRTSTFRPHTLI